MIPHFPSPYPGELFYSLIARHIRRSMEFNQEIVLYDLFGRKQRTMAVSIPFSIGNIIKKLEIFKYPTVQEILEQHTTYFYYSNIKGNGNTLREKIIHGDRKGEKLNNKGITLHNNVTKFLRFCSDCLKEDFREYGETFWRTSHQLPSVLVCVKHKTLLSNSSVLMDSEKITWASEKNCLETNVKVLTKKTVNNLVLLAKEAEYLAENKVELLSKIKSFSYLSLLKKRGFLSKHGTLYEDDFTHGLFKYWGSEVFRLFSINPYDLASTIKNSGHDISYLKDFEILFVLLFLSNSITKFLETKLNLPFGLNVKKEICHNAACKSTINYRIYSNDNNIRIHNTTVEYRCDECGMNFKAIFGDDNVFKNSMKYYYPDYQGVWKSTVHKHIYMEKKTINEVCKRYRVERFQIEQLLHEKFNEEVTDLVCFREKWINLINQNPNSNTLELKYIDLPTYTWLYRNDYKWLNDFNMAIKDNVPNYPFWNQRDKEMKEYLRKRLHWMFLNQYTGERISRILNYPFIRENYMQGEMQYMPMTMAYVKKIKEIGDHYHELRVKKIYSFT